MNSDLLKLLGRVSVDSGDCCQEIYTGGKKWLIPLPNQKDFWLSYCHLVNEQSFDNPGTNCTEKASGSFTLISNILFRYEIDDDITADSLPDGDELVPIRTLAAIIHCYQQVLFENFQLDERKAELISCVSKSVPWISVDSEDLRHCCIAIRIQFPYSRADLSQQKDIRRKVLSKIRRYSSDLFTFGTGFIHDMERAFQLPELMVPLYGSTLGYEEYPCELKYIWSLIEESDLSDNEAYENDFFNLLTDEECQPFYPVNSELVVNGIIDPDGDMNSADESFRYQDWLPVFLSIRYFKRSLTPVVKKVENARIDMSSDIDPDDKMKLALRFFTLINPERFVNQFDWITIGKICRSVGNGGLKLWIDQTQLALRSLGRFEPEFMLIEDSLESTCQGYFRTFQDQRLTVKTLAWMVEQDNPVEWSKWRTAWIENALINALSEFNGKGKPTDSGLAQMIYRYFWTEFAYDGIDWKVFLANRWIPSLSGIDLSKRISKEVHEFVGEYMKKISFKSSGSSDEERDDTVKKLLTIRTVLRNNGSKNKLIREASTLFFVEDFNSYLDDDLSLLGVRNGVLAFGPTDFEFRQSRPEDYISKQCPVEYIPDYTWESKKVVELTNWLKKMHADKQLYHHFGKLCAAVMEGGNPMKIFPILTGDGDNSKSMFIKLCECTYGPNCIKFPTSLLVENPRNASSSGPSPALARARGTRIAFVDEPEDDCNMNKGAIKRFTGGDSFFARLLNQNGGDHKASFVMFLVCNDIPVISNADKAIKRRTRIIPYLSKWVESGAPEDEDEQMIKRTFPQDPQFGSKIPSLASAFLWWCCQYFSIYRREGLNDPEVVKEHTQNYWDNNDIYSHFISDCLQLVTLDGMPSESHFMTIADLYKQYKEWMRRSFPSSKVPDSNIFRMNMVRKWGNMSGNGWYGVTLGQSVMSFAPDSTGSSSSNSSPMVLSTPPKRLIVERVPKPSTSGSPKPAIEKVTLEVKEKTHSLGDIHPVVDCV